MEGQSSTTIGAFLARRYQVLEALGTGGMGEVWCCIDSRTGRKVALKRIRSHRISEGRLASKIHQLFYEEVRALASLSHPNLVRALDFGQLEDGSPFLVMEYIRGISLESVWKQEQVLPWHLLAAIADQLLAGLAHIHARGIMHRDLKPPNILLSRGKDEALRVSLVDFGIAAVDEALDAFRSGPGTGSMELPKIGLGTPPYIAPEQILGNIAFQGPATDLHAFGILLHQFCCGQLPYWSPSLSEMLRNVANQPPPPFAPINEAPLGSVDISFEPDKRRGKLNEAQIT